MFPTGISIHPVIPPVVSEKVEFHSDPGHREAWDLVTRGLKFQRTVEVVGRFEVSYEGRASSYLAPGDRLLLIKPDGTLLVHQRRNRKPVNWQPSGSNARANLEEDQLVVVSETRSPKERLTATFQDVYHAGIMKLRDHSSLELTAQESQMQKRIERDPEEVESGFRVVDTEKVTDFGRVDVFGRDRDGNAVVVELKRKQAGPDAVDQLQRYVDYFENLGHEDVRGILASPGLSKQAWNNLRNQDLEHLKLEPKKNVERRDASLDEFG